MSLFANIKKLAAKEGISIAALEKEMGFGNGTMRRWDNSPPSSDKLQKVADRLNVSMDSLMDRNVNQNALDFERAYNETERRLLLIARRAADIPEEQKQEIINHFERTIDLYLKAKGIKGDE